jgi:cytochrome c biogenesis protein CcmG/thiol:disulfide interchange protein DsbE
MASWITSIAAGGCSMVSPIEKRKLFIGFGLLGLVLCCCAILVAALVFVDPFNLGISEKVYAFFRPTSTPTPKPTPDPCLGTQGPLIVDCPAPDFTLTTFDGQEISLAELRGKVVVINFWASWAIPCKDDVVKLQAVWKDYLVRGDVVFIGINYIDTDQKAREFIREFALTYPNGPDVTTSISQAYRITGVPETYIVDRNGILAFMKAAPFLSVDEVRAGVDPLLTP